MLSGMSPSTKTARNCGIEERCEVLIVLSTDDILARRGRGAGDAMLG